MGGSADVPATAPFAGAFDEEPGDGEVLDGDADGVVEGDLVGAGAAGRRLR